MLTAKLHFRAIKILEDGVAADIIKIRNQVANKEVRTLGVMLSFSVLQFDLKTLSGKVAYFYRPDMSANLILLLKERMLIPKPSIALRQATAAYIGATGLYIEGSGAVDRVLYTRARQYGQRNGWVQGFEGGSESGGRLHGKYSSNLPHKRIDGMHSFGAIVTLESGRQTFCRGKISILLRETSDLSH